MIYIAHRGNVNGPNPVRENSPEYIQEALGAGYDCEVDLFIISGSPYLGHDNPQYKVTEKWLNERKNNLWIHAKTFDSASWLANSKFEFEYFCHEKDNFTLTQKNYIWLHDLARIPNFKCIIPLIAREQVTKYKYKNFYAVCSDYILDCKHKFR